MKQLILISALFVSLVVNGQSDDCSSATSISVTANCSSPVAGTTSGATQTIAGCTGTSDDDVWYQFVATASSHQIIVTPNAGMDPVVQLFSGSCASLTSLVCKDSYGDGIAETINYSGLTAGNTYRIRVYHYWTGSGTGNFTICVTNPPPAPSNDDCSAAISLNVNSTCTYTSATTNGATESSPGCSGFADDDVWFSFVATNSLQNIEVSPIDNLDLVFQVYEGSCGSLNSLDCVDDNFTAQAESSSVVGLTPGLTYYVRVYDYYQGATGDFNICVTGTPTAVPTNDEPCNAILLPEVTSACQYSQFTTVGASASMGAPAPASCIGGSGPAIGGFSSSSSDVWFAIVVPPSGNVDVTPEPNGGAGYITDGVMSLYTGDCNSLTQIVCSDDHNFPGSSNDLLPFISESGLTPGDTVYLRYWGFGTSTGTFGICVSTATNDDCANALYICDINGYSASTSASYTPDRPDNMRGNNEDINGVNMPDGINTGGIFGQGGPWGTGAPFYDVVIDNNSWIKFTASSTSATLSVSIYDCWVGNYPSGGLQMQIFEGNNCTNFVPVSNFEESSTGFTITANNLTVGNDYYLMVDGYAGDICNYTITANSGVQFPDIANVPPICVGDSVELTAPPGASSYDWQHDGSTTQSVVVYPSTTETYYCEVTGLCDYKQMLDVTVTVNPNPVVDITNGASAAICDGTSLTLTATGASTYVWSNAQTGSSINVSPTGNTSYSVEGTDANGCVDQDTIDVIVNPNPTLTVNPTSNDSDCGASNGSLTGAVANGVPVVTYNWTDGTNTIGTSANLNNIPAGTYYLTVTDGNMCSSDFGPFSVSNPGAPPAPSITVSDSTPCLDGSVQLNATNSMGGVTFNWTGPNSYTNTGNNITLNNVTPSTSGSYCVSATISGCTGPSTCVPITVLMNPPVDVSAFGDDSTICLNETIILEGSGAISYSWTGPNGFSSTDSLISVPNATSAEAGIYVLTGTDSEGCMASDSILVEVLNLPQLTITADNTNGTYCLGTIANINVTGATNYNWSGPNGFTSTDTSIIIFDIDGDNQGYYSVIGTDDNGCMSEDSVFVFVVTNVPANSPGDTTYCPGETILLSGLGGENYVWTGPGGFSSNEQNPMVTSEAEYTNTGWYYLTVVDSNGCLGYDSTYVEVTNNENCLFIPNLLTPDGDDHNDYWYIDGLDKFEFAEVEIYNRWGTMIYYASPYDNSWDGIPNKGTNIGEEGVVPVGTYFYIIRLNEGDKPPFKGYIEVQY